MSGIARRAGRVSILVLVAALLAAAPAPGAAGAPERPETEGVVESSDAGGGPDFWSSLELPPGARAEGPVAPAHPTPRRGDGDRLRRLLDGAGAGTEAPSVPLSRYWTDLGRRLDAVLERWFGGSFEKLPLGDLSWLGWVARGLLALVLLILLLLGWRLWRRRRSKRRPPGKAPAEAPASVPAPAGDTDHRRLLEEHLAAGRLQQALEALWWWLARALAGADADPSWTGRELLRATGRRDLATPMRRLEALAYGGRPVEAGQVRRLAGELESQLSREPGGTAPAAGGEGG